MNAREKAATISDWLGWQHEDLSYGLKSVADAEKLYDHMQAHQTGNGWLPECADEWYEDDLLLALGYNPIPDIASPCMSVATLAECYDDGC